MEVESLKQRQHFNHLIRFSNYSYKTKCWCRWL